MRKNLATIVTKGAVEKALNRAMKENTQLTPATKFHLVYKNRLFPPKEVVRLAAKEMGLTNHQIHNNYWLNGGLPTNTPLEKLGFVIEQFQDWSISQIVQTKPVIHKISKICWNSEGWVKPSGRLGKSLYPTHEKEWGYAHEEWLLDFSKQINGYHYGFLEPINKLKHRYKYLDEHYNILLYSVCSSTKEMFWIGEIKNAQLVDYKECEEIQLTYTKRGWWKEMVQDLKNLKLDSRSLERWKTLVFNVKFKESDYISFPEPILIQDSSIIKSRRYIFLDRDADYDPTIKHTGKFEFGKSFKRGPLAKSTKRTFEAKTVQIPQIHNMISEGLEKELKKIYSEVTAENDTGFGTSIDMVVKHKSEYFFYEIKTYPHIMTCIRKALGQLMEYSYYPNNDIASKLYIVSQHQAQQIHKDYILHLRNSLRLPLHYLQCDSQTGKILQQF